MATRDKIFVSYSHKDNKRLEEFKTMLAPAIRDGRVDLWDDTRIEPTQEWKDEIKTSLASAKVAVLLVSQHFMASDFIAKEELPPLLDAAAAGGTKIFWIYLTPCLYQSTGIGRYQAAHDISKPLSQLPAPKRAAAWADICGKLLKLVDGDRSANP
jgi:hypothetical protein